MVIYKISVNFNENEKTVNGKINNTVKTLRIMCFCCLKMVINRFTDVVNANVNKFLRNIRFTDVENANVNTLLQNIRFTDVVNANVNKFLRNIRCTDVVNVNVSEVLRNIRFTHAKSTKRK